MTATCLIDNCGQEVSMSELAAHLNAYHFGSRVIPSTYWLIAFDHHLMPIAVVSARTGAVA